MLISKNINVNKRRTSMRLDQQSWETLRNICSAENMSIHDLCSLIDSKRGAVGLSTATRIFLISYLRKALQMNNYDLEQPHVSSSFLNDLLSVIYVKNSA